MEAMREDEEMRRAPLGIERIREDAGVDRGEPLPVTRTAIFRDNGK